MELSERKKRILKSVIDEYIRHGEPVGSKCIASQLPDALSSATVRNEMSELESMGYLDQLHSSSGRVPTTKGIRTYIEDLMGAYKLSLEELSVLNELLNFKVNEFGKLLSEAARVMSLVTNYTAVSVLKPPAARIEKLKTVYIDDESFLLILRCGSGKVKTKTVSAHGCTEPKLQALSAALDGALRGLTAAEINLEAVLAVSESAGIASDLVNPALRAVNGLICAGDEEDLQVRGLTKLLSYPEFSDVSKAKSVLEVLEQKHSLVERLIKGPPGRANVVMSGDGLPSVDASLVFYPITVSGQTVGAIGVIGPKRMDYKKVIANLEYFASGLTEELNGKNEGGQKI